MKLVTTKCIIHLHNHILFRIFFFSNFIIKNGNFIHVIILNPLCNCRTVNHRYNRNSFLLILFRNDIDSKGHDHFKINRIMVHRSLDAVNHAANAFHVTGHTDRKNI